MIVAMMPVRNEDWILGLSLRALLMWVDAVVVLDHCSTDGTSDIINEVQLENPSRIVWLKEDSPVWEEMRHRQRLLDKARAIGGTHMVIVDADEVLTGDLLMEDGVMATSYSTTAGGKIEISGGARSLIRKMVYGCPRDSTMELPWLCLRGSKDLVHRSGVWGEQNASMGFVDAPGLHWSSEGRGGYDYHNRPPMGRGYIPYRPVPNRNSGLMHMQFCDPNRLRYKQLAYCLQELSRWPGRENPDQVRRKYSLSIYGKDGPPAMKFDLAECPVAWWEPYGHLLVHYRPDAEPWQRQQCLDLLAANPGIEKGLDDFGTGLF